MLQKFFIRAFEREAGKNIRKELPLLNRESIGFGNMGFLNKACHWNSYNNYLSNKKYEVVPCLAIHKETGHVVVHIINYNIDTQKYEDPTLGILLKQFYDVFMLEPCKVSNDGLTDMNDILFDLKNQTIDRFTSNRILRPFYIRINNRGELC